MNDSDRRDQAGEPPSPSQPLRAPNGAIGWSPRRGWLHDEREASQAVEDDDTPTLVVSHDGYIRGVLPGDRAPLAALLRTELDVAELTHVLAGDVADLSARVEGDETSVASDVAELRRRVARLEALHADTARP